MKKRQLGKRGPFVSEIGIGCMGMVEFYGSTDDKVALQTLKKSLELGITFIDTADMYGRGRSEELIAKIFNGSQRDNIIISTKCGFIRPNDDIKKMYLDGSPEYIKKACEQSLSRLKTDYIDIYFLHRVDPKIPVEESIGAMKQLVQDGKVRHLGLSDTTKEIIKKASSVHQISAYQGEYSLWHRDVENDLLPACQEFDIAFIPYSPLGRGFLAGGIRSFETIEPNDFRKILPRFQPNNLQKNMGYLDKLYVVAESKNCTLAQLALAWLLAQNYSIIPIPGAKTPQQIEEDCEAVNLELSNSELILLNEIMPIGSAVGTAYPEEMETK